MEWSSIKNTESCWDSKKGVLNGLLSDTFKNSEVYTKEDLMFCLLGTMGFR